MSNCVSLGIQYVMYPQMTGTLKVPPLTFHGVIQVPNSSILLKLLASMENYKFQERCRSAGIKL